MSSSDELLLNIDTRGVMTITMNRPRVHNAFDDRQTQRLLAALQKAANDDGVRVVILASVGKSFSAGGDLAYMQRMAVNSYEENLQDAGKLAVLMKTLNYLPKPTIARVQGATFGGGVGLVSCCDIAIGSERAQFALSEVKIGLAPATIAPYVVRTIGEKAARRYFCSAEIIHAQKALQLGLLSEVVSEDGLEASIEAATQRLLSNGPQAVQKAKQIIFDVAPGRVDDEMIAHSVKFIADLRNSDEAYEGFDAFLEKRAPDWQ
ncbi:MAG: enoyl-CoA hydratase/isomerase family protein [Gammaproteobacteria bacterium]|nr:enoyl-CoA hydratase/isomerase family protein [Gammaproteobacteria bacterium]